MNIHAPKPDKYKAYRSRKKAAGLKQVRIWTLDASVPGFQQRLEADMARINASESERETLAFGGSPYGGHLCGRGRLLRRGDIVTVSLSGDHGKPRPAVVVQADQAYLTASVLVCLCTSKIEEISDYRLRVEPTVTNGLLNPSLVQAEKIHAVTRKKCGPVMGRLAPKEIEDIENRLTFLLGLGG